MRGCAVQDHVYRTVRGCAVLEGEGCSSENVWVHRVGQKHVYIRCICGIFCREFTKYTVMYNFGRPSLYIGVGVHIDAVRTPLNG